MMINFKKSWNWIKSKIKQILIALGFIGIVSSQLIGGPISQPPIEILTMRNKTTKVFDLGNNQKKYQIHSSNINYPDVQGDWQEIDTTLVTKSGGMTMEKNFYHAELPDLATGIFSFFNRDHYFKTKLVGATAVSATVPSDEWGVLNKAVRYIDVLGPGIHFQVNVRNMDMQKLIIFDQAPADTTKDFIVRFEIIEMPAIVKLNNIIINRNVSFTSSTKDSGIYELDGATYKSFIVHPKVWDSDPNNLNIRPVKIAFYTSGGKTFMAKIIPKEIFANAVYPIYADDPVRYDPPTAGNGTIESSSYAAWDTNHDATSGSAFLTAVQVGSLESANGSALYKIVHGFVPIDTSGITDTDTVTAAVLNLYLTGTLNQDDDGDDWINVVQNSMADPTTLVAGDFDQDGAINNPTEGSTRWDITGKTTGQYHTWTLNATGLTWVSKTSYTLLGVREGHDAIDVPVVTSGTFNGARATFSSDNTAGQQPYLEVTTTAAGGARRIINTY